MNLNPAMPVQASATTTGAAIGRRRCPDSAAGSLPGRLLQVSNAAGRIALRGLKAALREPGRTFTLLVSMLAGVRCVGAAPSGSRLPDQLGRVGPADPSAATGGDQWDQRARQIGEELALCLHTRHLADLDPSSTEAHCMGETVFNLAMGTSFDPELFREGRREAPGLGSEAGRYLGLAKRGMHEPVTMVKPDTVQKNIKDAVQLTLALPSVQHRIGHAEDRIIEDCNLDERVDNDALGQPGLFIRSDLGQVLQEACSEGALVPPTTREVRRANAALYFQSDRVKDERAFHAGQHRIHEGQASAAADAAFEAKVVDLIAERIRL